MTVASETGEASSKDWRDVAGRPLARDTDQHCVSRYVAGPPRNLSVVKLFKLNGAGVVNTTWRTSWVRLVLVAATALALLISTLVLELWLSVHGASVGLIPLP
jgi:hypothetical protein